ncbi:MAG: hypothetical protein Q7V01_00260 [Vicinamibacterales bacterium]|nr:hypothetical protein [Vicinamibacterales bacterium]
MRILSRLAVSALIVVLALASQGCGPTSIDIAASIKAGNLTTGWFDAGIVDGKNKLVPCASFTITNASTSHLSGVQIFSVFRFAGDTEELGSSTVALRGDEALAPSATSKPITVRANWGFTGEQPRAQMLMHQSFRDARVEIFVKYRAGEFVKIAEATISRQLLTH